MASCNILILGGTTDARHLASALAAMPGLDVTMSLAGRTTKPQAQPVATRIGGFGGADGLAQYLRDEKIDLLVDATHPFAARIAANAVAAAAQSGTALIKLTRPQWQREQGDQWIEARDIAEAVSLLPDAPTTVFLAIGRQEVAPFMRQPQHHYIVRSIDPVAVHDLPAGAKTILARGPFNAADEEQLFIRHSIDIVVAKNSGGAATYGKIAAAQKLRLPVIMVARPVISAPEPVFCVEKAVQQICHFAGLPAERGE